MDGRAYAMRGRISRTGRSRRGLGPVVPGDEVLDRGAGTAGSASCCSLAAPVSRYGLDSVWSTAALLGSASVRSLKRRPETSSPSGSVAATTVSGRSTTHTTRRASSSTLRLHREKARLRPDPRQYALGEVSRISALRRLRPTSRCARSSCPRPARFRGGRSACTSARAPPARCAHCAALPFHLSRRG